MASKKNKPKPKTYQELQEDLTITVRMAARNAVSLASELLRFEGALDLDGLYHTAFPKNEIDTILLLDDLLSADIHEAKQIVFEQMRRAERERAAKKPTKKPKRK